MLHHLTNQLRLLLTKHHQQFGLAILGSIFIVTSLLSSQAKEPDIYIHIAPANQPNSQHVIPSPNAIFEGDPSIRRNDWLTLPAGTAIRGWLLTPISTQTSQAGQPVEARTSQDIYVDTDLVIPKGATLFGQVTHAMPPKQGRDGILRITYSQLNLPGQAPIAIETTVHTGTPENYWGGSLTPGTERKIVPHGVLGIGYYNQEVLTGKRAMGQHISQPIGAPLTLNLSQTVSIPSQSSN